MWIWMLWIFQVSSRWVSPHVSSRSTWTRTVSQWRVRVLPSFITKMYSFLSIRDELNRAKIILLSTKSAVVAMELVRKIKYERFLSSSLLSSAVKHVKTLRMLIWSVVGKQSFWIWMQFNANPRTLPPPPKLILLKIRARRRCPLFTVAWRMMLFVRVRRMSSWGQLSVTKVAGNFHIAVGHAENRNTRHVHSFGPSDIHKYNVSHHIEKYDVSAIH